MPVADLDLLTRKLARIEAYVQELRDLARPSELDDLRERRFVEYTLLHAIQALLDVALAIVADERLSEPPTHRGLIDFLEENGWVQPDLAAKLREWVRLRHLLVFDDEDIVPEFLERIVNNHLDDILEFVQMIRQQLRPA
jgi:uncharacterized protein YutE (UPF0331/DUF86 family)